MNNSTRPKNGLLATVRAERRAKRRIRRRDFSKIERRVLANLSPEDRAKAVDYLDACSRGEDVPVPEVSTSSFDRLKGGLESAETGSMPERVIDTSQADSVEVTVEIPSLIHPAAEVPKPTSAELLAARRQRQNEKRKAERAAAKLSGQ